MADEMSVTERLREMDQVDDEIERVRNDVVFIAGTEPDVVAARYYIYLKRLEEAELLRIRHEMDLAMVHHINS